MKRRSKFAGLLLATVLFAEPALAGTRVYVEVAPPVPPVEVKVVAPGPNYVWIGGFHRWNGTAYVWVPGHWVVPPRPHVVWAAGHWKHGHGGWYWVEGRWK